MTIQTKYLGEINLESDNIIYFGSGLPGFIEEEKFILMDLPGSPVFQILQSIHTSDLAFIVTDPYHFYHNYTFKLDSTTLEKLQIKSEKDVSVLAIVTLTDPFDMSTVNLKAPLVINATKKLGKQYILNNDDYKTKASIVLPKAHQAKGE